MWSEVSAQDLYILFISRSRENKSEWTKYTLRGLADPLGVASVYKAYFLLHTDANVAEKCNNILHKMHGEKEVL